MQPNECAVVWIRGEHDASTVGEVARLLAEALASGEGDVIVDLSGALFLGVAPLQLMLKVGEFLALSGHALEFRAPSRPARVVLHVCGIPWTPAPGLAEHAVITGASHALESWVAVPTRSPDPATASPSHIDQPASVLQNARIGQP